MCVQGLLSQSPAPHRGLSCCCFPENVSVLFFVVTEFSAMAVHCIASHNLS